MKQLNIKVSEENLNLIKKMAKDENLTVTDLLLSNVLPDYMNATLTVQEVINSLNVFVQRNEVGTVFCLEDLFGSDKWKEFTKKSRLTTGRLFFKAYNENQFDLKSKIENADKNSANLQLYRLKSS